MNGRTLVQHWACFDYIGLGLWIPAIVCLILILQLGGQQYAWGSGSMIVLYILTPLLFTAYVFRQWRAGNDALTPARIMSQRTMIISCLYMLFIACIESQLPYFVSLVGQYLCRNYMKYTDSMMIVTNIFPNCAGKNSSRVGGGHFTNALDSNSVFHHCRHWDVCFGLLCALYASRQCASFRRRRTSFDLLLPNIDRSMDRVSNCCSSWPGNGL